MIHQYKLNGFNIVLDTYSGAVHCVDDLSYDIIALYENTNKEEIIEKMLEKYKDITKKDIEETIEEIEKIKQDGKLFSKDIYEGKNLDLKKRDSVVKALCLHVAHTCNLNCEYCFAGQGKYHGKDAIMSFEVGKQALDFLVKNSGTRKNLEVDFFGGEPLVNFDVVKQLVKYARSIEKETGKHFRFTLTTNGMLLDDDVIDFLNKEMNNVVLSLDGRKEINDAKRKKINGEGSYDIIVPKFQNFVEKRGNKEYYMRGTFTRNNLDFTKDIFHMADLGFKELSMEPVVSSPDTDYALKEEDLDTIFEQYEILAKEMIKRRKQGNPFTFYHYMIDLSGGPCIYKRITGCGSGTEYLAVTPTGDFYPCHQFVGDEKFLMGNVRDGVTNTELRDEFKLCNAYSRKECKDCWAKLYCSGGCSANAYHATGSINNVYEYGCKLFKKRIECAIMVKIAEAMEESEEVE
ncbi:MAG: thioether cross-link-forming SCIFF peptide maturase [Clostridia bacterium]